MEILMLSYWDFQKQGMQVTLKTPLYFAEQGHKVKFFVHSERTTNPSKIDNLHPNLEVFRFNLPLKLFARFPKINRIRQLLLFALFSIYRIFNLYRKNNKPDLIYAAECDAILTGSLLRKIYKVPFVTRYYGISNILVKNLHKHLFYHLSLKQSADLSIVTNDGTNGLEILKSVNPNIKEFKFWRNGIEAPKINSKLLNKYKKMYSIKNDDFVLLTVGRLYGWKRLDRAIKTVKYLKNRQKVKLLIVGEGSEKENLEKLAENLKVEDSVIFTGPIDHNKIYNIYEFADVLFSLHDMANAGNQLYEALNSSTCILTIDIGGSTEILRNGKNGIVVNFTKDEEKLIKNIAKEINALMQNRKKLNKLKKEAKKTANQILWTWDERLKAELESLEDLVKDYNK
ncbi:glycosyltransferase family 4 protein [candidate division WOR-3 bacterium]|nr:glycosyltransferase family 4 protein [candidate division WOR-3 bacterium]